MEKGTTVQVLDHGYITLVDWMGSDEGVVEAARMSTGKGFISWEPYKSCKKCLASWDLKDPAGVLSYDAGGKYISCDHDFERSPNGDLGLLDTLWRKKHATPFEMGEVLIEVQAPIFVFREWHRHRTQSYNEFSARYSEMPNLHYVPEEGRFKAPATGNKQAKGVVEQKEYNPDYDRDLVEEEQQRIFGTYKSMLGRGVPKEVARVNTPVSRYSKMRAKGNLRNWLAFVNLRIRPDAQLEIREYTNALSKMLQELFPKTWALFEEYDLYAAHLSRTELRALRRMLLAFMEGGRSPENTRAILTDFTKREGERAGLGGRKLSEFVEKVLEGGEKILAG